MDRYYLKFKYLNPIKKMYFCLPINIKVKKIEKINKILVMIPHFVIFV